MNRVVDKVLRALLTDPVTGEPLETVQKLSLAIGLALGLFVIVAMLVYSLGMGAGR